jgi:cytosine deaminase
MIGWPTKYVLCSCISVRNFGGNVDFLRGRGVDVAILDHPGCIALMRRFIEERPDVWFEDIGEEAG